MTEAPIFRSVNQALHVSYLMATLPPTQRGPTQVLLNDLMDLAGVRREVEREGTINFAGLSPLEVRAQCAMVIAAVRDHLNEPERRAVEAWYAHDASKADAVRFLCHWCGPHWTIEAPAARMMITWRINLADDSRAAQFCSMRTIEAEHGIPKSTVHDQLAKVTKAVMALRKHGLGQLEWYFEKQGVVGEPA